jgi:hypothetical protein
MSPSTARAEVCCATVRTDHGTPTRADRVACAVAPDNTASMTTRVDGATVTTDIERDTTGGLQSTVDDYVVNLGVADAVLDAIDTAADAAGNAAGDADTAGDAAATAGETDMADDADSESDSNPTGDSTAAEPTTDDTTQI